MALVAQMKIPSNMAALGLNPGPDVRNPGSFSSDLWPKALHREDWRGKMCVCQISSLARTTSSSKLSQ